VIEVRYIPAYELSGKNPVVRDNIPYLCKKTFAVAIVVDGNIFKV